MADQEERTSVDTFYVVDNSQQNVTLEIFINAPGQTAMSTIKLDEVIKEEGHNGSYNEKPLDINNNLAEKTLIIATIVTNTSSQSGNAKATVRLKGGQSPSEDVLFKTLGQGESVVFTYICKFFKS